eukprot:CAMPEP_0201566610 /NCGR_PEP_ID=MMETSP0190_2-20130828/6499_1 /ASSEMBLY_ACC=CAM_ASM_000263 /TAXON_ID=37353 /ORGANISM="Rosalina sp." /LENGTH=404 /DNA_ID=CAMNT_0047985551 /DNA_START=148 /DNA_END=1362 /DNA_ORIENTATION=-
MKAILALLLGLLSQSFADDDSVLLELESPDSDEVSVGDDSPSYGGLIIQVRQDIDGAPTVALGSEIDDYADVYCLNFLGLFEASDYDTSTSTSAAYTAIDGTTVDLANANCTTRNEGSITTDAGFTTSTFSIRCTDVGEATLFLTFTFTQDDAGDYGLEYIINLQDYVLSDAEAKLVMVQSLEECGDLIDLDAESVDEDTTSSTEEPEATEADDNDEETEEPTTTDDINRRRMRRLLQGDDVTSSTEEPEPTETDEPEETEDTEETEAPSTDEEETEDSETESEESTDAESLEEEDGISEDDSGEFDAGFARFVVNGQAIDRCEDGDTEINSTLVYQPDDGELHIVFDSFACNLILDPFYGLDNSKYELQFGDTTDPLPGTTEDNAGSFGIMIAMVMGLFVYLW